MPSIDWNALRAGALGAGNEALFGAPEWLMGKLLDPESKAKLQNYIAANKQAHDIGSTIGLVGSTLIPVGGVAKGIVGLGAKGARLGLDAEKAARGAETALELSKAAEAAGDIGKAADLAHAADAAATVARAGSEVAPAAAPLGKTLLDFATKGAAAGAAEQGARGFFKDESAPEIGQDVSQGILFGGLGGAAGGALSEFAPTLARLARKESAKATVGLTGAKGRDLVRAAQIAAGEGSGAMKQAGTASDTMQDIADIVKKYKMQRTEGVEKATEALRGKWNILDKFYESQVGGQSAADVLRGSLTPDAVQEITSKYGAKAAKEAIDHIMANVGDVEGMANIRGALQDVATSARSGKFDSALTSNAIYDFSKTIRNNLDDAIFKKAQAAGLDVSPEIKKEWGLMMPIAKGEVKQEMSPIKMAIGSPTYGRAAGAALLGGGSLLGDQDADLKTKLERAAGGAVAGYLGGKALSRGLRSAIASGNTLAAEAEKLAPKIAAKSGMIGTMGARLAANANEAVRQAAPTTEGEADAAKEGADLGQVSHNDYMSQVLAKLTDYAKANGVEPDTEDFRDFIKTVGASTIGDDGAPFDAKELSGLFYPDPEERAKFVRALEVSRGLSSNLGTALKSAGGIAGLGENPGIAMQKQVALDKLGELIGGAAKESGGTEAKAKKMLASIINSGATQAQKRAQIQTLMENYGVDFDTLGRVGLNV